MVEASAAVLEASTTASRANSLGKTDPHRMGRADKARRKLTSKAVGDYQIRQLPSSPLHGRFIIVSIEQIEEAIEGLPASDRDALESRLLARRFGLDALNEAERAELIASLDEAERDIDQGRTYNGDQLRQAVRSWLGK